MRRPRLTEIQSYISHLFESASLEQKSTFDSSDLVISSDPAVFWPHASRDLLVPLAVAELGSAEKSKREIIDRFSRIRYPFPEGTKSGKTVLDHLKSSKLVDVLLTPPMLWQIRMVWQFQRYFELQRELRNKKHSQHGVPLDFHREMLFLLSDHMERIATLAEEYSVPDQVWFREYYSAIQSQLLREGASYYPEFRKWFKPAHKLTLRSHAVSNCLDLYFSVVKTFRAHDEKSRKLARHVTAVICSPAHLVRAEKLKPDPETVRKYVKDLRRKNKQMQKSKMDKTHN